MDPRQPDTVTLSWRVKDRRGVFQLDVERLTIGRDEACGLQLDEPSVSREHARIFWEDNAYFVNDLGSSLGVIVNGYRLQSGEKRTLRPGDELALGKATLLFGQAVAPAAGEGFEAPPLTFSNRKLQEEIETLRRETAVWIESAATPDQALQLKADFMNGLDRYHAFIETKFREYEVLHQITQIIVSILDVKELLTTALRLVSQALDTDRGFILLYDPQHGSLRSMISHHFDRNSSTYEYDFTFSQTIAKSCFEDKRVIMIPDALEDERFRSSLSIVASSIRSVACIPLQKGSEITGVIYLDSLRKPNCFQEHQTDFLRAFASQTAIALENARLYTQAVTDNMTRLYNRKYMDERIFEEMVRSRRYKRECSLILLDIDRFKRVNDTYGHHAGDAVLEAVADALRENRRSSDILGRYGGEEFILLLTETNLDGAQIFAERLRVSIADLAIAFGEERLKITISCGVATYTPDLQNDLTAFVRKADEAMYRAKELGRNRICAAE